MFAPSVELSLDALIPAKSGSADKIQLEIADWSALPENLASSAEMRRAL